MGFYSFLGSETASQESLPGSNLIVSQQPIGGYYLAGYATDKALYWSTSITLSTGTYGIYFSNLSKFEVNFSISHPTRLTNNKSYSLAAGDSFNQYLDGNAQNINMTIDNTSLSWTTQTLGGSFVPVVSSIVYGNGIWVIAGDTGLVRSSTDGNVWTTRSIGFTTNITTLAFGNSIFVAGTSAGGIRTSTDAITWTARTSPYALSFIRIKYVNNIFLGSYLGAGFTRSTDGITWTSTDILYTSGIRAMAYGAGVYVAGGGFSLTTGAIFRSSTNGITWTTRASVPSINPRDIEFINNEFYAIGTSSLGNVAKSTNGITWTSVSTNLSSFTSSINFIKYLENEKMYISGGVQEAALSSTNGLVWKESFPVVATDLLAFNMAYNNGNIIIPVRSTIVLATIAQLAKSNLENNVTYLQISKIEDV
jgi:hypothetical protein